MPHLGILLRSDSPCRLSTGCDKTAASTKSITVLSLLPTHTQSCGVSSPIGLYFAILMLTKDLQITYDLITIEICNIYSNLLQNVFVVHPSYSLPLRSHLSFPFYSSLASSLAMPSLQLVTQSFKSKFNMKSHLLLKDLSDEETFKNSPKVL